MSWTSITVRFEQVSHTARKNLPCPGCGRKLRRQRTFTNTLNPFNQNPDGTVRTRQEIREKLRCEAADWEQEPVRCSGCLQEEEGS